MDTALPDATIDWLGKAQAELGKAADAWDGGNHGMARVAARRAAGMALEGWLVLAPAGHRGDTIMGHLQLLADDAGVEWGVREAAGRLCGRPTPAEGYTVPIEAGLTPMHDALAVGDWAASAVRALL